MKCEFVRCKVVLNVSWGLRLQTDLPDAIFVRVFEPGTGLGFPSFPFFYVCVHAFLCPWLIRFVSPLWVCETLLLGHKF